MPTAAETLRGLDAGSVAVVPGPFGLGDEGLEVWVEKVRADNGLREVEIRYHGVLMRRMAGKPETDGGVTWTAL